jgi:hypothetical protein
LGDELVALRPRRLGLAQALQAVLGADERGVERERTAEVADGRLLVPARFIDVAAVVLGERVHDFSVAVRLDFKNAGALNSRGLANPKSGDLEKAIADYSAAIQLESRASPRGTPPARSPT